MSSYLDAELCAELNQLPDNDTANQLREVMVDGIDAVPPVIMDGLVNQEPGHWEMAVGVTGNRDELLSGVRSSYMTDGFPASDAALANLLNITNTAGGDIVFVFPVGAGDAGFYGQRGSSAGGSTAVTARGWLRWGNMLLWQGWYVVKNGGFPLSRE